MRGASDVMCFDVQHTRLNALTLVMDSWLLSLLTDWPLKENPRVLHPKVNYVRVLLLSGDQWLTVSCVASLEVKIVVSPAIDADYGGRAYCSLSSPSYCIPAHETSRLFLGSTDISSSPRVMHSSTSGKMYPSNANARPTS